MGKVYHPRRPEVIMAELAERVRCNSCAKDVLGIRGLYPTDDNLHLLEAIYCAECNRLVRTAVVD